jgi:hypothetical protein
MVQGQGGQKLAKPHLKNKLNTIHACGVSAMQEAEVGGWQLGAGSKQNPLNSIWKRTKKQKGLGIWQNACLASAKPLSKKSIREFCNQSI